jgi:hypothetical protein
LHCWIEQAISQTDILKKMKNAVVLMMSNYIELSLEILEMLEAQGCHSLIWVKEKGFTGDAAADPAYYIV